MGLYDIFRNIIGSSRHSNTFRQNVQEAINKQYGTPAPSYTPLHTYPTTTQRVNPKTDVLYQRPPSVNINAVIDYEEIIRRPAVQEAFPRGALETNNAYLKRLRNEVESRKVNLDLLKEPVVYNPNPTQNFFASRKLNPSQKVFTTLDIETDDFQRPISISATKLQWDAKQKKFVAIDNYQRFYLASNRDLIGTFGVHGMTSAKLLSLRDQQKAKYANKYNEKEEEALRQYLGDSTIIGHNIISADLNWLFKDNPLPNSTIDTLLAARSAWKDKKNDLDSVFFRLFGMTMEQAGLPHHDPNADTIAAAMIAEKMAADKGLVGQSIRYVMKASHAAHIAEYDTTLGSMVTKGTYKSMFRPNDLYEVFMEDDEVLSDNSVLRDAEGKIMENPKFWGGSIQGESGDLDVRAQIQIMQEGITQLTELYKDVIKGENPALHGKGHSKMSSAQRQNTEDDLFTALNTFNNYKRMGLIKQIADAKSEDSINALRKAAGYDAEGTGWDVYRQLAAEVRSAKERENYIEQFHKIDKLARRGQITEEQATYLKARDYEKLFDIPTLEQLDDSFESLVEATNEMIKANERLAQTYHALADIKPYDMNNLVGAAHSQWSGIMGAAQGVVPGFVLNPINRIGRAYLNRADRSIAPWNAVQRFYNEVVGTPLKKLTGRSSIAGAIGGPVGAGIGVLNAGTQAAGNYMQARLEMKGYDIQNNLNTLGAMISWIATPFKLLHKATKLLIGSFGGLSYKLNSFMGQGIEMMMQMGNPLSTLTGVNYGSYVGTTMMDRAALLNRGSMNATMENFATQQRMFYTMGQVDTNRLIASSMLGVYDKVYSPTNDVQGAYTSMANKLLNDIKTQDPTTAARTMALAEQIDKNLPQLLETAKLLDVQDINMLMNPGNRGMYWRPVTSREEQQSMRWTQYEYGAARDQLGVSKMRVANAMWNNLGGKRIYNAINEFVDGIAKAVNTGEWDSVVARATEIWQTARDAFDKVWTGLSNSLKGDNDNAIVNTFKAIGLQLENVAITFAQKVISVWDELTLALLRKVQGAIAYLSTVKIDFDLKDGKLGFKFTSIKDAEVASDSEPIYKQTISALGNITNNPREGMSGYAQLYEQLFPNASDITIANATVGDIRKEFRRLHEGGMPVIGLSALGYEQIGTDEATANELLLRAARQGWGEAGAMEDAASMFLMRQLYNMHLNKQDVYDKTGIYGVGKQFIDSTEDVAGTLLASKYNDNVAKIDVLIRDTSGKKVMLEADSKGNLMSTNLTLLQQMIPKGIDLVVSQLKGN